MVVFLRTTQKIEKTISRVAAATFRAVANPRNGLEKENTEKVEKTISRIAVATFRVILSTTIQKKSN